MNRRKFVQSAAAAGAVAALARPIFAAPAGRLNQSVCFWTYQKWFTLDALCQEAVRIGLKGIDLVDSRPVRHRPEIRPYPGHDRLQ